MKTISAVKNNNNTIKTVCQLDAVQSVRRGFCAGRTERPLKGGGYRRPQGNKWANE